MLNLLNFNANRQNVNILSDFIQNEVWKLVDDEELKLKKYSMKKTKLIDYYEAKLKSEPQHEKYTPTNFAAFLL